MIIITKVILKIMFNLKLTQIIIYFIEIFFFIMKLIKKKKKMNYKKK